MCTNKHWNKTLSWFSNSPTHTETYNPRRCIAPHIRLSHKLIKDTLFENRARIYNAFKAKQSTTHFPVYSISWPSNHHRPLAQRSTFFLSCSSNLIHITRLTGSSSWTSSRTAESTLSEYSQDSEEKYCIFMSTIRISHMRTEVANAVVSRDKSRLFKSWCKKQKQKQKRPLATSGRKGRP